MSAAVKTLAAIDAAIVGAQELPFRAHLGASVIGKPCARALWYDFHWTLAQKHEAKLLRLFKRGQDEEARFVGYLRDAGMTIWEKDENGKQFRVGDCEGHFGGSLDGVGRGCPDLPADEPFLLEFKTHGEKSFKKLTEDGLLSSKWAHYVQMQIYMGKMGFSHGLYCAVNKNTDELYFELVAFNDAEYQRGLKRAQTIIFSVRPPERLSESPSYMECKFCHLHDLCHFGGVTPERNCRTCRFSKVGGDGLWVCGHPTLGKARPDKGWLDEAAQRAGCDHYQPNPLLTERQP